MICFIMTSPIEPPREGKIAGGDECRLCPFQTACMGAPIEDRGRLNEADTAAVSAARVMIQQAEAAKDADVVYTDAWYSMGQEAEMVQRRRDFAGFQVDAGVMGVASPDAVFLHCLPAHRGDEASDDVLDGPAVIERVRGVPGPNRSVPVIGLTDGFRYPVALAEAHRAQPHPHNRPGLKRGYRTREDRPEVLSAALEVAIQRQGRASPCAIR